MKNKLLISTSLLLASINCLAAQVIQVNSDTVVISTEELKTESAKSFVIDLGQGEQCIATLKSTKEAHLLLDTKSCQNKDKIRAGQTVANAIEFADEPVPQKPEIPLNESKTDKTPAVQNSFRKFNFSLTPAAILSGNLTFPLVTASDSGGFYTGNVAYKIDPGISLRFDFGQSDQNAFNLSFGGGFEGQRNVSSATLVLNGTTSTGSGSGKVSTTFLSTAIAYRWETYYLGLGVLAASVTSDGLPSAVKNLTGGVGADVHMGWFLKENLALDISSRAYNVKADTYSISSGTISLGNGFLNSVNLGVKFLFL